jgi:DNA-binding transcriptional LysR family regulator
MPARRISRRSGRGCRCFCPACCWRQGLSRRLIITPVAEDELVLVVPKRHPWARRPPRTPAEIAAGPWVLREPGSGTRAIFEAALPRLGLAPGALAVALEVPSNEAVRAAVEAGTGVTAISRLVVANAIKAGTLAAVKLALPRRHFFLLRHRERYATKAAQAFVEMVVGGGRLVSDPPGRTP